MGFPFFCVWLGLMRGNVLCHYLLGTPWDTIADRSLFQGVALGMAYLRTPSH